MFGWNLILCLHSDTGPLHWRDPSPPRPPVAKNRFVGFKKYDLKKKEKLSAQQRTHLSEHTHTRANTYTHKHTYLTDLINMWMSLSLSPLKTQHLRRKTTLLTGCSTGRRCHVQVWAIQSRTADASQFYAFCLHNCLNSTWHWFHEGCWNL